MSKPFEIKRDRKRFLNMVLKHEGTYGLKEFPFSWGMGESTPPPREFVVDRWTPNDERGKNRISEFYHTAEGWLRVLNYPLWYGFEPIAEISRDHLGEYFDLVIIRPNSIGHLEALELVSRVIK